MSRNLTPAYETIGQGYRHRRQPDPRIAEHIWRALADAETLCNIGAGTGSYEPLDRQVVALEPSQVMIDQRVSKVPVVRGIAENLPFADHTFDAAMALLSVHHWKDASKGLAEMKRISRRQVVFAFDTELQNMLWLVSEYLPEIESFENDRSLSVNQIAECLGSTQIIPVPIPWDCTDGFQAAYWQRPEQYLLADVQQSISTLAQLPKSIVESAMKKLAEDLKTGVWKERHANLIDKEEMDFGYRLIVSGS